MLMALKMLTQLQKVVFCLLFVCFVNFFYLLVNYGGVLLHALLEHWPIPQRSPQKCDENPETNDSNSI